MTRTPWPYRPHPSSRQETARVASVALRLLAHAARPVVLALLLTAPARARAQGGDTVTVEQRVLMTPDLTPAAARRRAIDGALAEAARQVAGVTVRSTALSTLGERNGRVTGGYASVVQLEIAARAVDYRVLWEEWETLRPAGAAPQLYLRLSLRAVIAREIGNPDPAFTAELSLNAPRFIVRSGAQRTSDELIATVRTSHPAHLILLAIADDSVHRLFPNEYVRARSDAADMPVELPAPDWRERGLHLRATLPSGVDARDETLMLIATHSSVSPPPAATTVMALQRWLVGIPLGARAIAFTQYEVARDPPR